MHEVMDVLGKIEEAERLSEKISEFYSKQKFKVIPKVMTLGNCIEAGVLVRQTNEAEAIFLANMLNLNYRVFGDLAYLYTEL